MSASFCNHADDNCFVTVVTSSTNAVNKTFFLQEAQICNRANATIYQGYAETVPVNTSKDLERVITSLSQNQAIALGRLKDTGRVHPLTTKAKLSADSIARSKDFFRHSNTKGWLLLDVDTKDLPSQIKAKLVGRSIFDVLINVIPELLLSEMLVRASSSAGISKPDGAEREATGLHIYLKIGNQIESRRLLQLMHDRLWEAGYGFYGIAKNGNLLERSLLDTTVHGPERLIFEAKPNVLSPLKKRDIPDEVFCGGVLNSLREPNRERVCYLKNAARDRINPRSKKAKPVYVKDATAKVVKETGLSKAKATKIIRQRLEGRELGEHDILELGRNKFVKVSDFLDRATGPVGMPCPIEGSSYGTSTAYYYPRDSNRPYPRIISFAHGSCTEFTFERFRHLKGLVWLPEMINRGGDQNG